MNTQPGNSDPNSGGSEKVNPDELINMVHEKRGLPPGSEAPRRPERITHHEIKALKTTTQKDGGAIGGLAKIFGGILGSIAGVFGALLPNSRGSDSKTRCNLNGHVFPRNWSGDYPVCTHCGQQIKSPDERGPRT